MNNTVKTISLIAAGLVVGAAIGVLFAPEEGNETRKKIMEQGKKLVSYIKRENEQAQETLVEMKEMLQEQLDNVNQKLNEAV